MEQEQQTLYRYLYQISCVNDGIAEVVFQSLLGLCYESPLAIIERIGRVVQTSIPVDTRNTALATSIEQHIEKIHDTGCVIYSTRYTVIEIVNVLVLRARAREEGV